MGSSRPGAPRRHPRRTAWVLTKLERAAAVSPAQTDFHRHLCEPSSYELLTVAASAPCTMSRVNSAQRVTKYALLTEAGGGLGGASAKSLAAAGWTVFAADVNQTAVDALAATPGIIPVTMDVTDDASVNAAVQLVQTTTKELDAVINFAGTHTMGSMIEGDIVAVTSHMIAVNVMGMVRVNRAFFEMLTPRRGRIINCSSECGYMKAQPFNGPYTMTKYAVEAYSDSLRRELLSQGIKVIKIQPGSFETGLLMSAQAGFDRLYADTGYYKRALAKMQPFMKRELHSANDPAVLAKVVVVAAERKNPRINYRVKNSRLMRLVEFIPDRLLDAVYKIFMK